MSAVQQVGGGWHHEGLYVGMHWGWWIFWIAVLAVLGWAFWRYVREERERRTVTESRSAAEEILRERFGRGELTEEEFLDRMRTLRESRS